MPWFTPLALTLLLVVGVSLPRRIRVLRRARRGPRPTFRSPGIDWALGGGVSLLATVLGIEHRPDRAVLLIPLGVIAVAAFVVAPAAWNRDLAARAADPWTAVRVTGAGVATAACYAVASAAILLILALAALHITWRSLFLIEAVLGAQQLVAWMWVRLRPVARSEPSPSPGA